MTKGGPPKIDIRKFSDLLKMLKKLVPHYTPEWAASDEKDAGVALLKIFCHVTENVVNRLNQVPHKNFVAFLDMLGIKLLPAQPSRAPLTFKLAEGTEKEILIPARTQAATDKTEEHEELPFETEKNLLAVPSDLKRAISVEPFKDAIFVPPPGFLEGKIQEKTELAYKIVSSPTAGAKDFQLDHVTDLKEGDYLKIGNGAGRPAVSDHCVCSFNTKPGDGDGSEYVIISSISGTIVSATDRLLHSYPANTPVEKLIAFTLFEGKNMQEHSLYIGHKDLFNIKSTAQFILEITHLAGTTEGVTPLKLLWEYWGEAKGEEGEDWRKFYTIDITRGLSKEGEIELIKKTEGEIKEKEINGIKSRWIRCIIEEPLPVNVPRKLPVLDSILFQVKSSGKNLLPDQAFNNDIPLDITQPFNPFGKEPRMFDTFSIAGKEIFSKKGAKITFDVEVEPRGVLGAPTAISYGQKIKIFARGTYGRLIEVEIDPSGAEEPFWRDHGFPPDTRIAPESQPAAETYSLAHPVITSAAMTQFANISVFARATNGHLVERYYNGNQWQWLDHGTPKKGITVTLGPAVIYEDEGPVLSVFVTGSDGSLYEYNRIPDVLLGMWFDHGKPGGKIIASSPYGDSYVPGADIRLKVFVQGEDGNLYELDCKAGDNADDKWETNYGAPPLAKVDSRPFAKVSYYGSHVKVYVKGSDGRLWEFDTTSGWDDKELPDGKNIDSDPHGYIFFEPGGGTSDRIHIFARDPDGNLLEWNNVGGIVDRINHQAPANLDLRFSPFALDIRNQERLHIFSVSSQNSILERKIDEFAGTQTWNEHKDPTETALTPTLSWEYWNKKGWIVLKGIKDETANLLKSGKITFNLPEDIDETEIAGQKNYWIRARIVGGDYGKETFIIAQKFTSLRTSGNETGTQQLISTKNSIRPPIVNSLTISYAVETKQFPQQCQTYNNLEYLDRSEACKSEDKFFAPFVKLEDITRTIYLGFEKFFKGGPIKIFFGAKELPFTAEKKPKLEWSYSAKNKWGELSCLDATEGLIRREILELLGPSDFSAHSRFGNYLYWIKGSLAKGEYEEPPLLDGIYPNTTWAFQAETIKDEILGSSDGEPNQTFSFLKFPVLQEQEIRMRETLSEEEKQALIGSLGKNAIYEVKDEKGYVTETWVLWTEVPDFFDSTAESRHYTLDRATGELQFGDGINGMIPPAGDDNIKAFSYQAGGGAQGNVKAGEVKTLKSAVAGVDRVSNPVAADGGADTATLDQMLEIGPAMISHRNRAVTVEDFEWLAKQASRKVVKVRCLPNTNNKKVTEIGWVTVIIVPDSLVARPFPSLELRRKVRKHLENHCANTIGFTKHIYVDGPFYVEINVSVDVFVTSIDLASEVDRQIRTNLNAFFHPLTGGAEGKGWDFGRDVSASDIYALLEGVEGVDRVENLGFSTNGTTSEDIVEVERDVLVASGTHTVNLQLINGGFI